MENNLRNTGFIGVLSREKVGGIGGLASSFKCCVEREWERWMDKLEKIRQMRVSTEKTMELKSCSLEKGKTEWKCML